VYVLVVMFEWNILHLLLFLSCLAPSKPLPLGH
jgi:hypothetical protein